MWGKVLSVHDGLLATSRLRPLLRTQPRISPFEIAALVVVGCGAAFFSGFIDLPELVGSLFGVTRKVPGNTIFRSFLPLALGVALVPRHLAGTIIGACAVIVALALNHFRIGNAAIGDAAVVSLGVTGVLLDFAVWGAKNSWRLYAGFVMAGLASSVIGYGVRAVSKYLAGKHGGRSGSISFENWLSFALGSYLICGVIAGLLCAIIWFRFPRFTRRADSPVPA